MAIPEDIFWDEFPSNLSIESLDDLFGTDLKKPLPDLLQQQQSINNSGDEGDDDRYDGGAEVDEVLDLLISGDVEDEEDEVLDLTEGVKLKPQELKETNTLEVVGSDSAVHLGGIYNASKLYAYEDFVSFLAREVGIDHDRLARLVGDVSPRPDEDFVEFLARCNGIKDEHIIERLRQALELEPVFDFPAGTSRPVEVEVDTDFKVRDGEDAATFFARVGSWVSASSVSEELASVGLDEFGDEDAESFFKRKEDTEEADVSRTTRKPAAVTLLSVNIDSLKKKQSAKLESEPSSSVSVEASVESSNSTGVKDEVEKDSDPMEEVISKARKSSIE